MAKQGSTSARPRVVEKEQRDAWAPAQSRTWADWLSTAPATLHSGGGRRNREASWRWKKKDPFAISKNSRDHSVNKQ